MKCSHWTILIALLTHWPFAAAADDGAIRHLLERTTFGATPALMAHVGQIGMDVYIEEQLHPDRLDDSVVEDKLRTFDTLGMAPKPLVRSYYDRIKLVINNQQLTANMPAEARLRYGIERFAGPPSAMAQPDPKTMIDMVLDRTDYRAIGELQTAKIIRAVLSNRQLYEVMVDFWTNHFNIDVKKGLAGPLKVVDDREVIRRHALGNFKQLLAASAHSPAMLVYLDNNENSARRKVGGIEKIARNVVIRYLVGISADAVDANGDAEGMIGGLNENYGRELLELHTLGVDGGYGQADVIDVARAFTGWTSNPFNGQFSFNKNNHDQEPKRVLGQTVDYGNERDGQAVLDLIALHPATARHIARKLCQRFVSDVPDESLIDVLAGEFLRTKGDIPSVLRALFRSDAFFQPDHRRTKLKSPLEFVVSSMRLLGADIVADEHRQFRDIRLTLEAMGSTGSPAEFLRRSRQKSLNWRLVEMGQPLFGYPAPTGYPEDSSWWRHPALALQRMNFALAATAGAVADVALADMDADAIADFAGLDTSQLVPGQSSDRVIAAALASPAFQYR